MMDYSTRMRGPGPEPPPGKSARTRLRLVDAVRREIEDAGAVNAGAVARRAESSPATFYNHFSSKDEAVLAAFDATMEDLVAVVREGLDVSRALEMGLEAFLRAWTWSCIEFFRANSLVFGAARALSPASREMRRVFEAREAESLELYVRFVRLGQHAQMIAGDEPEVLGELFMLSCQGWNHPRFLRIERGGALHEELSRSVHAMLTRPTAASEERKPR